MAARAVVVAAAGEQRQRDHKAAAEEGAQIIVFDQPLRQMLRAVEHLAEEDAHQRAAEREHRRARQREHAGIRCGNGEAHRLDAEAQRYGVGHQRRGDAGNEAGIV